MKKKQLRTVKPEIVARYSKTDSPPFECKFCDYKAKSIWGVIMHHNKQHGGAAAFEESAAKPAKRPYNRKNEIHKQDDSLNFCPHCGVNLAAVRMAIKLSR